MARQTSKLFARASWVNAAAFAKLAVISLLISVAIILAFGGVLFMAGAFE